MTITEPTTEPHRATEPARRPATSIWRGGAVAAVTASAVNAVVWSIGRANDVAFLVPGRDGGEATRVALSHVVGTTLLVVAIGTGVAVLAVARSLRWFRAVLAAGVIVALASAVAPLTLDTDASTRLLLASMHLVAGTAFVVGLRLRRAGGRAAHGEGGR